MCSTKMKANFQCSFFNAFQSSRLIHALRATTPRRVFSCSSLIALLLCCCVGYADAVHEQKLVIEFGDGAGGGGGGSRADRFSQQSAVVARNRSPPLQQQQQPSSSSSSAGAGTLSQTQSQRAATTTAPITQEASIATTLARRNNGGAESATPAPPFFASSPIIQQHQQTQVNHNKVAGAGASAVGRFDGDRFEDLLPATFEELKSLILQMDRVFSRRVERLAQRIDVLDAGQRLLTKQLLHHATASFSAAQNQRGGEQSPASRLRETIVAQQQPPPPQRGGGFSATEGIRMRWHRTPCGGLETRWSLSDGGGGGAGNGNENDFFYEHLSNNKKQRHTLVVSMDAEQTAIGPERADEACLARGGRLLAAPFANNADATMAWTSIELQQLASIIWTTSMGHVQPGSAYWVRSTKSVKGDEDFPFLFPHHFAAASFDAQIGSSPNIARTWSPSAAAPSAGSGGGASPRQCWALVWSVPKTPAPSAAAVVDDDDGDVERGGEKLNVFTTLRSQLRLHRLADCDQQLPFICEYDHNNS